MLDYLTLQGSTENPTFLTILFTVLLAFLLSSLIAFTYERTTRQVITPIEFLQSLILVSIVAATVMQAIGDSLARGLGMFGALAIIRYRTTLRSPRNMVFTFAALTAGISCGVYGFVIGIIGTLAFCTGAFILRFSPMMMEPKLSGSLKFDLPVASDDFPKVETTLKSFCDKHEKIRSQITMRKIKEGNYGPSERIVSYEYNIALKDQDDGRRLDEAFSAIGSLQNCKINFEINIESI